MTRTARFALYLGTALCVVALSKAHAVEYHYTWSGSSRFAWSVAYVGALCLAAYAFGLPELPRSHRSTAIASIAATARQRAPTYATDHANLDDPDQV